MVATFANSRNVYQFFEYVKVIESNEKNEFNY